MRIVLVGGASGGHFYPLMAISESLDYSVKAGEITQPELYYIGPNRYDTDALAKYNISYISCPAGKKRRYPSILNFLDIFKTIWGVIVALKKLFVLYPDVIMSKGGYTSVPVTIAGWLLRIPIVIHESDATPGKANKLASHFAKYIAISYTDAAASFPSEKTAFTGIPIRSALFAPMQDNTHQILGTDANRSTILVLGGSQGAERVNELILQTLDELLPHFNVIHQTGQDAFEVTKETAYSLITDTSLTDHYHPIPFMTVDMLHAAMSTAAIVISRAGSGTIHEIAIHGKPSILIPIPEDISHDQRTNAYAYARTGAASVLEEKNLTDGLLEAEIIRMMDDRKLYTAMSEAALAFAPRNAAEKIAATLIEIGIEHE